MVVEEVDSRVQLVRVFNFSIANAHNYFVGGDGVLVHNVDPYDILFRQDSIGSTFGKDKWVPERWRGKSIVEAINEAKKLGRLPDDLVLNATKLNYDWVTLNNRTLYVAQQAELSQVHPIDKGEKGINQMNKLLKAAGLGGPVDSVKVRCK